MTPIHKQNDTDDAPTQHMNEIKLEVERQSEEPATGAHEKDEVSMDVVESGDGSNEDCDWIGSLICPCRWICLGCVACLKCIGCHEGDDQESGKEMDTDNKERDTSNNDEMSQQPKIDAVDDTNDEEKKHQSEAQSTAMEIKPTQQDVCSSCIDCKCIKCCTWTCNGWCGEDTS